MFRVAGEPEGMSHILVIVTVRTVDKRETIEVIGDELKLHSS